MDPSQPVPTWELWSLVGLFFGSFFFSGTETALTSLGEAKSRQLRERLGSRGQILSLWIDHPKKVLTTLLIGNNLVNVAAASIATDIALRAFGSAALAIVTGVMTLLLLIFGEITPKTLAREHAEAVAVPVLWLLRPFYGLFYPLAWTLVKLTNVVGSALGGGRKAPVVTGEEIDYLIGLGSKLGAIEGVKKELLTSVLEFTDLLVKEIMIPRTQVMALEVSTGRDEVLRFIEETEHSRIPVFESTVDNVVGVLYVKDLLPVLQHPEEGERRLDLRAHLRPAFFVPEVMKVARLMKEMQSRRTHIAIVVDEFGGTSGIVTLEDVVEEIVGEIQDEHDVDSPRALKRLPDGKILADAAVPLRDLEDLLEIDFPDEGDYETLGGFLTATAGRVPPPGSLISYGGFTFTIRGSDEKRVLKVEIARTLDTPGGAGSDDDARPTGGAGAGEGASAAEPAGAPVRSVAAREATAGPRGRARGKSGAMAARFFMTPVS